MTAHFHGGSGFAVAAKTNEPDRERSQLCDRHWVSFRDAGDPVPNVWNPYFLWDFWSNRASFYRDFYREVISSAPFIRMVTGQRSS
jgi:hypothetical protein